MNSDVLDFLIRVPTYLEYDYINSQTMNNSYGFCKKILAISLGFCFVYAVPSYAEKLGTSCVTRFTASQCVDSVAKTIPELAKADVVYLGETHDSEKDHQNQLEIIKALYQRRRKIAIALEMFQRPYQEIINQYLTGKLTETELVKQTEYEERWGFPWKLYAPILRYAKTNKIPVLALNTPSEISRKVSRNGLESLTKEEQKQIPPFSEIRTDNPAYKKLITDIFNQHQGSNSGNSKAVEKFFLTQVLWDETMAETIAKFIKINPQHQIVTLAGQGHIIYGYGIPSRVKRRLPDKNPIQRTLLLSEPDNQLPTDQAIADIILK
jgi:uncharacterized iron-regulated protein